jgi:alcohol oxidase
MAYYEAGKDEDIDIIFAGDGTAACGAAASLAKANPELKVLLIEGGPNNFQEPTVATPCMFPVHLFPDSKCTLVSDCVSCIYH